MSQNSYAFGRSVQLVGLMILPFAIVSELTNNVGLGVSMLIAGGGALLFYFGYLLQGQPQ